MLTAGTAGQIVTLVLGDLSHTKAQSHKVKSINQLMMPIGPCFVPWCEGFRGMAFRCCERLAAMAFIRIQWTGRCVP
ncbi:MAG: hypothetical protein DWH91_05655 [Planctomycetota bacterium]|nr:MAG: hypothetical protein DWH91_05655 [Planctomycetota bacterium]